MSDKGGFCRWVTDMVSDPAYPASRAILGRAFASDEATSTLEPSPTESDISCAPRIARKGNRAESVVPACALVESLFSTVILRRLQTPWCTPATGWMAGTGRCRAGNERTPSRHTRFILLKAWHAVPVFTDSRGLAGPRRPPRAAQTDAHPGGALIQHLGTPQRRQTHASPFDGLWVGSVGPKRFWGVFRRTNVGFPMSNESAHAKPQRLSACAYLDLVPCGLIHRIDRDEVLAPNWQPLLHLKELHALHPEIAEVAAGSFREKEPPQIVGSGYVVKSLEAALWAFHDARHFREAVLRAVNLAYDADTTGAVCGQLAGAYWGASRILEEWREGLARKDMIERALEGLLATTLAVVNLDMPGIPRRPFLARGPSFGPRAS